MLELLNQTGAALARELDLDRLVQTVTDAGVQLVGAAFGAFFYNSTDASGQHLLLYTLSGAPHEAFAKFPLPGKTALFGPTLDGAAVVRSDDIVKDPRYGLSHPHHGMPPGHLPVRSYLAVPVVSSSGEVHGGLFFGHPEPAVFKERAERVVVGIAAQAAIAIDNARLLRALKASERRFRALIEHSADGVAVVDGAGFIRYFSPSACALEGHEAEAMLGKSCMLTTHPEDVPLLERCIDDALQSPGQAVPMTFRRQHKDGRWLWMEGTLTNLLADEAVGGMVANYRDVTARKLAQESLIRSQKMEALGTLAGGIAHDFNNILLAITGNIRLAADDLPAAHPAQASLTEVSQAAGRATDLVSQILAFSQQRETRREVLDVKPVAQEALALLRATLPALIEIRSRFEANLPAILADSTQIHQLLMNLVTNAAHAIGPSRGLIEVSVEAVTATPALGAAARDLSEGRRYVRISVTDDGSGMDKAVVERIFDPFYTTKRQGTGLGLSVVAGIVKSHDALITVCSEPARGSAFHVYFLAAKGVATQQSVAPPVIERGAGQRVLYIDDDEALVNLMRRVLERLSYRTTGCVSPRAALELFRANPLEFDVVVTDLSMPGLSGLELAATLHQLRPDMLILLTSGYVRPEDREAARSHGVREVLLKPYTPNDLSHALQRMLARSTNGPAAG